MRAYIKENGVLLARGTLTDFLSRTRFSLARPNLGAKHARRPERQPGVDHQSLKIL